MWGKQEELNLDKEPKEHRENVHKGVLHKSAVAEEIRYPGQRLTLTRRLSEELQIKARVSNAINQTHSAVVEDEMLAAENQTCGVERISYAIQQGSTAYQQQNMPVEHLAQICFSI